MKLLLCHCDDDVRSVRRCARKESTPNTGREHVPHFPVLGPFVTSRCSCHNACRVSVSGVPLLEFESRNAVLR